MDLWHNDRGPLKMNRIRIASIIAKHLLIVQRIDTIFHQPKPFLDNKNNKKWRFLVFKLIEWEIGRIWTGCCFTSCQIFDHHTYIPHLCLFSISGPEAKHAVPHGPGLSGPVGGGAEEPLQVRAAPGGARQGKGRPEHPGDHREAFTHRLTLWWMDTMGRPSWSHSAGLWVSRVLGLLPLLQMVIEKKKAKKIAEQKKAVDTRLDQEMNRNTELQKEMYRWLLASSSSSSHPPHPAAALPPPI